MLILLVVIAAILISLVIAKRENYELDEMSSKASRLFSYRKIPDNLSVEGCNLFSKSNSYSFCNGMPEVLSEEDKRERRYLNPFSTIKSILDKSYRDEYHFMFLIRVWRSYKDEFYLLSPVKGRYMLERVGGGDRKYTEDNGLSGLEKFLKEFSFGKKGTLHPIAVKDDCYWLCGIPTGKTFGYYLGDLK